MEYVIEGAAAVGGIADHDVQTGSQQLALEMRAGRVISQGTRLKIGGKAHPERRKNRIPGVAIVTGDERFQVCDARGVINRQADSAANEVCIQHGHAFAEPKSGRLLLWSVV